MRREVGRTDRGGKVQIVQFIHAHKHTHADTCTLRCSAATVGSPCVSVRASRATCLRPWPQPDGGLRQSVPHTPGTLPQGCAPLPRLWFWPRAVQRNQISCMSQSAVACTDYMTNERPYARHGKRMTRDSERQSENFAVKSQSNVLRMKRSRAFLD